MDGDKLRLHIEKSAKSVSEWLDITRFSKSRLYAFFKQGVISFKDRQALGEDFGLGEDFWDDPPQEVNEGLDVEVLLNAYRLSEQERDELITLRERCANLKDIISNKDKLITILEKQLDKQSVNT
jgi:hypothetical protein